MLQARDGDLILLPADCYLHLCTGTAHMGLRVEPAMEGNTLHDIAML